ncbi:MAG: DEAD/DEAH box helicase [Actinomycetota bacterium]|nr:DEAD/DEAH box helicase [Actinomycetota bacterium]
MNPSLSPMTLERFASRYPFPLDDFQLKAIEALSDGESVLVAAPTGSGKTVVAEFAVERALEGGGKAFYTTPLKALSNQKFGDFVARYGAPRVGLLTGDNSINADAPVVVMTTEVLRNMLYEQSRTLEGLGSVIMDEVHYLQDPYRGAVWEEVLIHLPLSVSVVCLSATISNAEQFGEWIGTLRGTTRVVIEERRPVPLEHHYLTGRELHAMHVERDGEAVANPYIVSLEHEELRVSTHRRRSDGRRQVEYRRRPREGHRRVYVPHREEVVEILEDAGMLPAIYFVFSRAGCDRSVQYVMQSGVRLTSREEAQRIRDFAEMRAAWMDEDDLHTLGFYEFVEAFSAGVASHHAGMIPIFKETVEEMFEAGLVKVVFATETLSLGINMPAKTVVIEDLWKFQGERHEVLTPGEYTQLTGRAGRRGIDEIGHAVVLYQRQVRFQQVASLATTRTYELSSSFRPSYNMTVNLVRNYSREETHHLLNSSFAQFLADRSVVALERELEHDRAYLNGYREQMACDRGDFQEYWALRERARRIREDAEKGEQHALVEGIREALAALKPGDVIFIPRARRRGLAAVISVREGRPTVLTQDRRMTRLSARDFEEPPVSLARIKLPGASNPRQPRYRREVAARLVTLDIRPSNRKRRAIDPRAERDAERLERQAAEHPCATCPDLPEHERWATRASKLEERISRADRHIRTRTETVAVQFDRVMEVLQELEYVRDFSILPKGSMLTRIYGEADILVTEALADGLFDDLSPAETAALVSTLVYESRERFPKPGEMPTRESAARMRRLSGMWRRVRRAEDSHHVELCRELEAGFATPIFHWAEGKPLEDVLHETEMAPGDFVRNCKQLIDLLRQIEDVAPDRAATSVRAARESVNRGVVAYTGL